MVGKNSIRVGVCGFPVSQDRLFRHLDVIEIQKTFYNFISEKSLLRLREKAPSSFLFTMKAFQGITHPFSSPTYRRSKLPPHFVPQNLGLFQPTPEVEESARVTVQEAKALQAYFVVVQCPPSFEPTSVNIAHLYQFFENLERGSLIWGFEPRGKWSYETIKKICQDLSLIHIVDPFYNLAVTQSMFYFRLHGRDGYHYRYTPQEIKELAQKLRSAQGEIFCLFNNTAMWENALELKEELLEE
ncbi:MAG TPA: DUF72 domain-containing protein [Candidatus Atribacteria bacterium]|nr:DUF72 domain-containing protein [Candidatus Atribacteria bacterium]HQE25222.1 DUF72 domain-containing protein [Candidatus Atribacteria bacterium]